LAVCVCGEKKFGEGGERREQVREEEEGIIIYHIYDAYVCVRVCV